VLLFVIDLVGGWVVAAVTNQQPAVRNKHFWKKEMEKKKEKNVSYLRDKDDLVCK